MSIDLTWADCYCAAKRMADRVYHDAIPLNPRYSQRPPKVFYVYPIPNGGIPAALIFSEVMRAEYDYSVIMVESPEAADFYVDDIYDSGATIDRLTSYRNLPWFTLFDRNKELDGKFARFPWERMARVDGPEDNIRRILQYIGEDPDREGLKETPSRVVRSYAELFGGYKQNPADVMKVFEDGACDEMVVLKGVSLISFCEHHMLPFTGVAHIAYIPDKKVIGVSKLARLLDIYSRRLQIQERLTKQVTQALMEHLKPLGAACVIEASHSCMSCRGVGKQQSTMITSSLEGVFLEKPEARNEFFSMIGRR